MKQVRSIRLEEVAALAGVSTATVSRFLNKPDKVALETRERIRAAVEATGYVPNMMAGALAGNRSRLIAVLVPEIAQSLFNDTVEAMIKELSMEGNNVVLALTGADNARLTAEIEIALARQVDAIILTGILTDAEVRKRLHSIFCHCDRNLGPARRPDRRGGGFFPSRGGRGDRQVCGFQGLSQAASDRAAVLPLRAARIGFCRAMDGGWGGGAHADGGQCPQPFRTGPL